MSWTDLEYEIVKFYGDHRYDAFTNPDKVGLGRCGCGEDMYYCNHSTHFARKLIAHLIDLGVGLRCPGCGEYVPIEVAYRDGPRPFHWNEQGGGHTMDPIFWKKEHAREAQEK